MFSPMIHPSSRGGNAPPENFHLVGQGEGYMPFALKVGPLLATREMQASQMADSMLNHTLKDLAGICGDCFAPLFLLL